MKILELRIKNLNSLYGEWRIDFTAPEYRSDGIFALTGSTGAGKSTILDAICLALYGATPRLGRITKSANEIMSRQTGECIAEVTFESEAGRYLCHWSQHRARKKADGRLAEARHEISDAHTGKPIETMKSRVLGIIEEKTGMDFDRFTRSILLAQGGFDTFLKAGVEQKSRILEQITGTEIYSEISLRVHERQREERQQLNQLQAEIAGISLLESEHEAEIRQQLDNEQLQETGLDKSIAATKTAIDWLRGIESLKQEISKLDAEENVLKTDFETFKPDRVLLDQALRAAVLEGDYATLTTVRKQQETDLNTLQKEDAELPGLKSKAKTRAEALHAAVKATLAAKQKLQQAAPVLQQVRGLDQALNTQKTAVAAARSECENESGHIAQTDAEKMTAQQQRQTIRQAQAEVQRYLDEHARDKWLVGELAGLEQQLESLAGRRQELIKLEAEEQRAGVELGDTDARLQALAKQFKQRKSAESDAVNLHAETSQKLNDLLKGRLLREYRDEKEALLREQVLHKAIADMEEERYRLVDGSPCPLCGALDHPYARGNIPSADENEKRIAEVAALISKAESQESVMTLLAGKKTSLQQALAECENEKGI